MLKLSNQVQTQIKESNLERAVSSLEEESECMFKQLKFIFGQLSGACEDLLDNDSWRVEAVQHIVKKLLLQHSEFIHYWVISPNAGFDFTQAFSSHP